MFNAVQYTVVLNLGSALELNHFLFGKAELKCHSCDDGSFFFFFKNRGLPCHEHHQVARVDLTIFPRRHLITRF